MEVACKEELFPEEGCEQRRWRGRGDTASCQCVSWAGTVSGGVRGVADGITAQALGQTVSPSIAVSKDSSAVRNNPGMV